MFEMNPLPGMTEADRELRAALQEQRRQIAGNVERLACGGCTRPGDKHDYTCPLAVAAAIREGRL